MERIDEGTDLKYRVSISGMGFDMLVDTFVLEIRNQYGLLVKRIDKADCLVDGEGGWFFTLEAVKAGKYYVTTVAELVDDDYEEGVMRWTNRQLLCKVGVRSLYPVAVSGGDGLTVRFERVTERSIPDVPADEEVIALKEVRILNADDVGAAWRKSTSDG